MNVARDGRWRRRGFRRPAAGTRAPLQVGQVGGGGAQERRGGDGDLVGHFVGVRIQVIKLLFARVVLHVLVSARAEAAVGGVDIREGHICGIGRLELPVLQDGFQRGNGPPDLLEEEDLPPGGRALSLKEGNEGAAIGGIFQGHAAELGHGRGQVHVARELIDLDGSGDVGAPDDEGHPDVRLVGRVLPREEAVLAHVEAVVRGEEDVGVGEHAIGLELAHDGAHHVVDRLERLEPETVLLVQGRNVSIGQERQLLDIGRLTAHIRLVERGRPGRLDTGEHGRVARGGREGPVGSEGREVHEDGRRAGLLRGLVDEAHGLGRHDVSEVVRGSRAVADEGAVRVQLVVVLAVRVPGDGTVPFVPSRRDVGLACRGGIPVQVLAEEEGLVAPSLKGRGDGFALHVVGISLLETPVGGLVGPNLVVVRVLSPKDPRP